MPGTDAPTPSHAASSLGSVLEQVDRESDRALEEAELEEHVEAGDRVDVLVGAALDDPHGDERERVEGDPGALERPAERETASDLAASVLPTPASPSSNSGFSSASARKSAVESPRSGR